MTCDLCLDLGWYNGCDRCKRITRIDLSLTADRCEKPGKVESYECMKCGSEWHERTNRKEGVQPPQHPCRDPFCDLCLAKDPSCPHGACPRCNSKYVEWLSFACAEVFLFEQDDMRRFPMGKFVLRRKGADNPLGSKNEQIQRPRVLPET